MKQMPFCKNCGSQIAEDATFCQNCGMYVKDVSPTLQVAGWGERFVAWLIDMIILGIILAPTLFFYALLRLPRFLLPPPLSLFPFIEFGFSNFVYFVYWTLMEGTYGQSIGKMIMHLKVRKKNGQPIDIVSAAIESFGKAFLLPLDCIIGWLIQSNEKQRLFNIISETVTVKL